MRRWAGSLLLLSVMLLAACGVATTQASGSAAARQPDTVRVTRMSHINTFPPLDVTVRDAAKAQRLYAAIKALPPFETTVSCPEDTDLEYHLSFLRGDAQVALITINATGCSSVVLAPRDLRGPTPAFWTLFANTLNVSEPAIFPSPADQSVPQKP